MPYRPHLVSSTTRSTVRPLVQQVFGVFDPLRLNPYLMFDSRESMLGELEAETLDLNPADPSTLDVITATRSGVATYTDVNGVIQTAPANTVRIDHVDGVPMMLIEPSAENLLSYSEDFSHSSWSKTSASVENNAATAPDGSETASKITVDSANTFHFVQKSATLGALPYSLSAYLKADTATTASFFLTQGGNNGAVFDIQAGSVISVSGTGNTASIEDVGNGWFRCVVTNSGSSDLSNNVRIGVANGAISNFQGNGTDSILVWGAQLEEGSVATSYIPTSGSTVTRNADNLVIDGSDFTDFYNQAEGTVYVEVDRNSSALSYPVMIHGGSSANYLRVDSNGQYRVKNAGVDHVNMTIGSIPADSLARVAFSYKYDDFRGSVDGGSEVTDNSGAVPAVSELQIGAYFTNSSHINGHIKRLIYWPTHSDSL